MPTSRDEFRRQFPTHHDAENHYAAPAAAAGGAAETHAQRVRADRAAAKHRVRRRIEAFETGAEPPSEEELMVLELCTRDARPWLKRYAAEVRRRRRLQPRPRRNTV